MQRKTAWKYLVWSFILLLLAVGIYQCYSYASSPRQSAIRLTEATNAKGLHNALFLFHNDYHRWPNNWDELKTVGTSPKSYENFIYVGGHEGILAFQKEPCRAVKAGEPWSDPGETTPVPIPAARIVIFDDDREVEMMDEDEFQKKYKPLLAEYLK